MSPGEHRSRPGQDGSRSSDKASTSQPAYDNPGLRQSIDNSADDWLTMGWLSAIRHLAASPRRFTADDVRDLAGSATDFHYHGAAFASAAREGLIEAVGARIGRDGRPLRVWVGVQG